MERTVSVSPASRLEWVEPMVRARRYLVTVRYGLVAVIVGLAVLIAVTPAHPTEKLLELGLCFALLLGALRTLRYLRDRADEQLRRSQMLLADAEQLARFGSWEWDIRANLVSWSANLHRILGLAEKPPHST